MIEWFLLDRIDAEAAGSAIGRENHLVARPPAHETKSTLSFMQLAESRAEIALHTAVLQPMPIARWDAFNSIVFGYLGHSILHPIYRRVSNRFECAVQERNGRA